MHVGQNCYLGCNPVAWSRHFQIATRSRRIHQAVSHVGFTTGLFLFQFKQRDSPEAVESLLTIVPISITEAPQIRRNIQGFDFNQTHVMINLNNLQKL